MAQLKNTTIDTTLATTLPSGTTGQRPALPQDGYMRYNTNLNSVEIYNDGNWVKLDQTPIVSSVTGFEYTTDIVDNNIPYKLYVFYNTGGNIVVDNAGEIEYLILAGGGGGERHWAGGGGAGGLIEGKSIISPGTYAVTVGSGGAGGTTDGSDTAGQGGNSSVFGLTAIGGGPGAGDQSDESPIETFAGGSGGGAGDDAGRGGGAALQPTSSSGGIGYPGGFVDNGNENAGAGGGGAGEPGQDKAGNRGGAGGDGILTSFFGYPLWIGGGGGACSRNDSSGGYGGLGGGGLGATGYPQTGFPAGDYLGGGGGGGTYTQNGGDGGNGIVAIRYKRTTGRLLTPSPINDNLALHVDAADTTSYWNGHRTRKNNWYDTVGNNAGAFVNSPTFSGKRGGVIEFDTSNYIDFGSNIIDRAGGDFTLESWVRYNTVANSYNNTTSPANFFGDESIAYNSWYWGVLTQKLALWDRSQGTWKYGSTILQPNTWYHTALVCYPERTRYQFYLNGVAEGGDHASFVWTASDAGLRIRYIAQGSSGNVRRPDGDYAIMRAYFRALGPLEIKQNFEAYRGRFGI